MLLQNQSMPNAMKMGMSNYQQTTVQGRPAICKTISGWQICCQWKGSSTSWEKLSELKEFHPVQTTEFAVVQGMGHKPAFNCWVKHVLKKRDRIIASIRKWQTRYLKGIHKFCIELPKAVEQAHALDVKSYHGQIFLIKFVATHTH